MNDDAIVEPGWAAALIAALEADPRAAAAQGVNLVLDPPELADGCGIAWNRWWQAVQIGHGKPAPGPGAGVGRSSGCRPRRRSIAGRRCARSLRRRDLRSAARSPTTRTSTSPCRLRAAGFGALLVPAARARHAGSLTGRTLSRERWRLIYGNRWRVAERFLGGGFWPRVPLLAARDGVDLARALLRGDGELAAGIVSGWGGALRGPR